jgi:hypothetical protein
MAAKTIDFDVIIKEDGSVVHDVQGRSEGADCRVVKKIAQRMGQITKDEQTGPFCDKQNERT